MNHHSSFLHSDCVRTESGQQATSAFQKGQALLEGMIALLVLLSLWVGVTWLGRLQDMGLQATHASRYAAFALGRDPLADIEAELRQHYFSGSAHQWADRRGKRLLGEELDEVSLSASRDSALAAKAQAGGVVAHAQALRQGWRLEDSGILASQVSVAPVFKPRSSPTDSFAGGLANFDTQQLILRRHTAILTGAGHASDDLAVQKRVAASFVAWGNNANASYTHGAEVAGAMALVDAAWNRTEPVFDWLEPWAGQVPELHIGN